MINEEIREKEVRVIGKDGAQMGIMSIKDALEVAAKENLDLALIAPKATPPTCKIMDYGKFKFEEAKREKENRKNQKVVDTKEVRLSPSIDTHDFETKLRNAVKFLKGGDKVKVTVRFRGREVHHSAVGEELLNKFAEGAAEVGIVDKQPKLEGRNMAMFLSPKK
ncbi:MAG: translation initiation factor IF-3 [Clostridia bacterium]|nr:translation initiation factor IF-3 [Clostridia bacterium]